MAPGSSTAGATGLARFRRGLLGWFHQHQRKLPWRGERDPYRILVSEIMLQQTRVAVVEDRYRKFVASFPTVQKLAKANEEAVLAAWSGLGYYRRARSLQRAAREIAGKGVFPGSAAELMELPGVGRYTAAAVASISFGEPVAVVDGNVKRVLERVFAGKVTPGAGEEQYWEMAKRLLDRRRPGDFNQAMMELGALVCLPGEPLCHACPMSAMCAARGPVARKARQTRRKATQHYMLARKRGAVLLRKRPQASSLMPGMWELPLVEAGEDGKSAPLLSLRHSITNTDYKVHVHAFHGSSVGRGRWFSLPAARRLPLTGLARKILERIANA